jgi:SulP family sulfate permease
MSTRETSVDRVLRGRRLVEERHVNAPHAQQREPSGARTSTSWGPAWLPEWSPRLLRADLVAGLTLAAYLLPAALGDASLANLPPEAGLYACLFAGLVYWWFSGARHTAITVTSAISLLVGQSLGPLAGGDTSRFAALAALTALLTGAIALVAWVARAGVLVEFISETVLVGFKAGIALVLISTQLPKLLGVAGSHGGGFFERCAHVVHELPRTNGTALLLGVAALAALLAGKKWLANRPIAVLVVVAGIGATALFDLPAHGVKTLGAVPEGLPVPGLPGVGYADGHELLPLALACFLLGAVESAAIGRMFAARHGYAFDANRELLGLAAANAMAGLGRGFPVSGGMSQSLVNEAGGAKSPLSGLFAALLVLVVVLTCAGLLRDLPQPVLAAIVLVAVGGLLKLDALRELWRFDRTEFLVAMVVLAGVLTSGILRGVLIGAAVSLLLLVRRAARPRVAELGRVPGTDVFADHERHPENLPEPDATVLRVEGPLLYFNARHVQDEVLRLLAARPDPRLLVLHLGMTVQIDLAGCELLAHLHEMLARRGITLRLAEVHGRLRDVLRRYGWPVERSPIGQNQTAGAVLTEWRAERHAPAAPPAAPA